MLLRTMLCGCCSYPDFTMTASGLQFKDLREGSGETPQQGVSSQQVTCNFFPVGITSHVHCNERQAAVHPAALLSHIELKVSAILHGMQQVAMPAGATGSKRGSVSASILALFRCLTVRLTLS